MPFKIYYDVNRIGSIIARLFIIYTLLTVLNQKYTHRSKRKIFKLADNDELQFNNLYLPTF